MSESKIDAVSGRGEQNNSSKAELAKAKKDEILRKFCPTFCFAKSEYIFPTTPEKYAEDVLRAKMAYYIPKANKTPAEQEEFDIVRKFFPDGLKGRFDIDAIKDPAVAKRIEREHTDAGERDIRDHNPTGLLFTFDEKKFGYRLGSKVPIGGEQPDKERNVKAPVYVSYMPTDDGAIIRAECFYALSGAIPGTNWLYKMLPHSISKKLGHFAVHAGDWEGVFVKVKIDENGSASLDHMRTFAHGRSGSVLRTADQLEFDDNGAPKVFVGAATHPSYAENFVGRNKFLDKVGEYSKLDPRKSGIVDLSPDTQERHPVWTRAKCWGQADLKLGEHSDVKSAGDYIRKNDDNTNHQDRFGLFSYVPMSQWKIVKFFKKVKEKISHYISGTKHHEDKHHRQPTILELEILPSQDRGQSAEGQFKFSDEDARTLSRDDIFGTPVVMPPKKLFTERVEDGRADKGQSTEGQHNKS